MFQILGILLVFVSIFKLANDEMRDIGRWLSRQCGVTDEVYLRRPRQWTVFAYVVCFALFGIFAALTEKYW